MPFCSACKFQVMDNSISVCPNCGAPIEIPEDDDNSLEHCSPDSVSEARNEDDNLQICDPGDLLCAEQPGTDVPEENTPIGETMPPPPPPADEDIDDQDGSSQTPKAGNGSIQKLSDEQVNNIRSNMLNSDSEYVSAEDASSIIHDLSKSNEGPSLERKDPGESSKSAPKTPGIPNSQSASPLSHKPNSDDSMPAPSAAPMRKVAYFHKNFIQLTGSYHPTTGEEMVIDDRHYLLKQKKVKPQYTIGVFSVLVVLLLFVIGKQFISPTLPGSGSIIGVILDEDGRPIISGAEISLPESGKKVNSDAIGFFRFDNVPTGVYVIRYKLSNGKVGTENISVANDEITTLSLSTEDAQEQYTASSANSSGRQTSEASRSNQARNMPPVPEEKKQQASGQTNAKKEYSALKLRANVDGAKLIVNGEVLGAGNMTYKKLSPGKHKAKVTKNGYKSWSGGIRLDPNETYTLAVELEPIPAEPQETSYSAEDFYQSGQTMFADGNIDAAVQDFSEAIKLEPSMADAYVQRAEVYTVSGKVKLAEADYIRAGEIYTSQKRNEAALESFNNALNVNGESVAAYINRGDLYRRSDAKEKALRDFKSAVKYDKDSFRGNFELGKMYFSLGNHKDADKRLRKARDIDPRNPEVYHYLMLNYFARDDFNKVRKTYGDFRDRVSEDQKQAFKENPRFDAILRIVGEYERP